MQTKKKPGTVHQDKESLRSKMLQLLSQANTYEEISAALEIQENFDIPRIIEVYRQITLFIHPDKCSQDDRDVARHVFKKISTWLDTIKIQVEFTDAQKILSLSDKSHQQRADVEPRSDAEWLEEFNKVIATRMYPHTKEGLQNLCGHYNVVRNHRNYDEYRRLIKERIKETKQILFQAKLLFTRHIEQHKTNKLLIQESFFSSMNNYLNDEGTVPPKIKLAYAERLAAYMEIKMPKPNPLQEPEQDTEKAASYTIR